MDQEIRTPSGTSDPSRGVERPILFSAPMVRAIMEGRKTQTRRIVKPRPSSYAGAPVQMSGADATWTVPDVRGSVPEYATCPYGKPGDRLWVRETCAIEHMPDAPPDKRYLVAYKATCDPDGGFDFAGDNGTIQRLKVQRWRPSIHMPRWASRITLEVVSVRVGRLQDISEEDADAEGVERIEGSGLNQGWKDYSWKGTGEVALWNASWSYRTLWEGINGAGSWEANPWVWCIEFRVRDRSGTPQAVSAEEYSGEPGASSRNAQNNDR